MDRGRLRTLDVQHVWHPYTQSADHAADDFAIIERAEGRRLYDVDGRAYWDGVSSIWLNVHGHRVPEIDAAIRAQLGKVAHSTLLGQANVPSIELAKRLADLSGLPRVFYSDNGSTAVEAAIKIALQAHHLRGTGRHRVVAFEGGYHGDTLGCVTAAYVPLFHAPFRPAIATPPTPLPFPRDGSAEEAARCLAIVQENLTDVAALLVEPVQGVGGIRAPHPGFLQGLRRLCTQAGVYLIADEVATGFGRTGTMFACQAAGITPDLMALGKGLTGGYLPLAATLASEGLHQLFVGEYAEKKQFFHGHSFTGNQLGCAAALASLDLLEDALPAAETQAWLADRMQAFASLPHVKEVRGRGWMWGIELEDFPFEARAAWHVYNAARERGLLVRPFGNVCLFLPPLGSTREELETMLALYEEAFLAVGPQLDALVTTA